MPRLYSPSTFLFPASPKTRLVETRSHEDLTCDHTRAIGTWSAYALPAGQALRKPATLSEELDERVIEEYARTEP